MKRYTLHYYYHAFFISYEKKYDPHLYEVTRIRLEKIVVVGITG